MGDWRQSRRFYSLIHPPQGPAGSPRGKDGAEFGKIDILVCNAAVNPFHGSITEIPDSAFDRIMECNIRSNVWLCNMVLPDMRAQKDGVIMVISSIGGVGDPASWAPTRSQSGGHADHPNYAVELV